MTVHETDTQLEALSESTGIGKTEAQDDFEAQMASGRTILHRQKLASPRIFHPLMFIAFLAALFILGPNAIAEGTLQAWLGLGWILGVVSFIWSMFYALRTTVTPEKVNIKFGLLGPSIPIDKIVHCEAEEYWALKYGGYGVRYAPWNGTWAFNMLGDKGKAVRIHYKTLFGVRKVVVSSLHPNVLADAINQARVAKGHDVDTVVSDEEVGLVTDGVLYDELVHLETEESEDQEHSEEVHTEQV